MAETRGIIFKIKRFSIHDGPGIRTSVFLKGCPLNCVWCHSPEGIDPGISIWYNKNLCIKCRRCIGACPEEALQMSDESDPCIIIDRLKCKVSGGCVSACPSEAMQFTGTTITPSEVFSEVLKDTAFYSTSGGGLTLTGGEPLFQPDFTAEILKLCRTANIHTAMETSLFAGTDVIKKLADLTDLFITDLKILDPVKHKFYTGESNEKILMNFRLLAGSGKKMIVRVPLVDRITNTEENRHSITGFINSVDKTIPVEFIVYNPLAGNNYRRLGIPFPLE